MKKLVGLAILALPLMASRVGAWGCGIPYKVNVGGDVHFNLGPCYPNWAQLGPWYLYWPMEAHFVAPAPTGYPYWPSPQGLPGMAIGGPAQPPGVGPPAAPALPAPAPVPAPAPAPAPAPTGAVTPTGYYPASTSVPSYWYDR
jgi:hypothetical protein